MDKPSPNQVDVLNVMDATYGLVDGSTAWPECVDALVLLAGLGGTSMLLYDCARDRSQVVESKGRCGRVAGQCIELAAKTPSMDDFLWRSRPGALWQPSSPLAGSQVSKSNMVNCAIGCGLAPGYAVIDRDRTHVLYLEFASTASRTSLEFQTVALLENLLPHLHRACRLCRSLHGNALLALVDPEHAAPATPSILPIEHRLRRRFQLSKAEARVAKLLAEGLAPRVIADRLHVSIHTVRSQLQSIFQKTETSRQAELTSLLLRETELPTLICRTTPADLEKRERTLCL